MLVRPDTGGDGHRRRGSGALVAAIIAGIVIAVIAMNGLPDLNPFGTETRDRSQPAVLRSIEKLSEYRAATANLQVIIDIEKDAKLLPSFIKGEKTLLVAAGRVDARVDFSRLRGDAVVISKDGRGVTLTVPPPTLAPPQLDLDRTRVYDRDRGLIDRVEGVFEDSPTSERDLLRLAQRKLAAAAAEDRQVLRVAETNTREMLTGLLRGLGYTRITVRFGELPSAQPR